LARRLKASFERAVELDPNHIDGREGLVQFYLQAPGIAGGSVAKAREQAAEIRRISPHRGHLADATIANDQKDLAGAERAYRAAASALPDSVSGVAPLLSFLSNNGRAAEAFPVIDGFLARHPDNRAMQYWLGRTAAVSGQQLDRGEAALRQLLTTPSDNAPRILPENVHYRLGDIAAKRGDLTGARAEYGKALALNPDHQNAKDALRRLPGK
jgi:tetratricopeptide (TPR) repeat protein